MVATTSRLSHSHSRIVTIDEMEAIPAPDGTSTWRPVAHRQVVDAVHSIVQYMGLSIAQEEYSVTQGGKQMFGLLKLSDDRNHEWSRCIGVRNGNDKTMALGIAIGAIVHVCDNRCFSGERVFHRRHTSRFELEGVIDSAFDGIDDRFDAFETRLNTLKGESISYDDASILTVKIAEAGGIPDSQVMAVLREFRNPSHKEFTEPTRWNLVNAFTEIGKRFNQPRHRKFQKVLAEAFQLG